MLHLHAIHTINTFQALWIWWQNLHHSMQNTSNQVSQSFSDAQQGMKYLTSVMADPGNPYSVAPPQYLQ